MWITFTKDFDFYPPEMNGRSHVAYKAGMSLLVRKICAARAIKAGAATTKTEKENDNGQNSQ